ncbi:MAG: DUF6513 domain-containing protein [Synergistales bacterium]|nr:DUF6513 domain-containing protein [Synergistales bacterium]
MAAHLFLTGQLAEASLRATLAEMAPSFDYGIHVLPITVAALADCGWIAARLPDLGGYDTLVFPGLCQGDGEVLAAAAPGVEVLRGPEDLKDLPGFFGLQGATPSLSDYRIEIAAEIVDAHLLAPEALLAAARRYARQGADIIDLGGPVSGAYPGVAGQVTLLREEGFRVSADSFHGESLRAASRAGAELLLSVNSSNIEIAPALEGTVVLIPDFDDRSIASLERNMERLRRWGVPFVVDPVLDPFPFGLLTSLERYIDFRRRYPEVGLFMGIGNQTELVEADSTGINALLAAICTDLDVGAVLTTSVVSWAAGAVAEFDRARRLMHYARERRCVPKHAGAGLVTARDLPHSVFGGEELGRMQEVVRDDNYRIFVSPPWIYIFNGGCFLRGASAEELCRRLAVADSSHAFYLGRELQKAQTALELGKRYRQDQPLDWGYIAEQP